MVDHNLICQTLNQNREVIFQSWITFNLNSKKFFIIEVKSNPGLKDFKVLKQIATILKNVKKLTVSYWFIKLPIFSLYSMYDTVHLTNSRVKKNFFI